MTNTIRSFLLLLSVISMQAFGQQGKTVFLAFDKDAAPRIQYGIQRIAAALRATGASVMKQQSPAAATGRQPAIVIGLANSKLIKYAWKGKMPSGMEPAAKEAYSIKRTGPTLIVSGSDPSGVLYGCLELEERIRARGAVPWDISIDDHPEMVLRGECIGLQKPFYLPGRQVYEYPYTPGTFPWFYDKQLWLQVLDSMMENRMNSLYLWNGHPFASLVRLKGYPYAVEVSDEVFRKNEEIYRFITEEADKRGIWVIQMFYNILVSKPFAAYHHIKTQDRERPIIPVIADYTRKSIAAFVEKYPNVGLMVCLGEAMEGTGNDDIEWFTQTIIPGVKDGLKSLGKTEEPPIVLRAHDTDAPAVMKAALPLYKNLYTEAKFNGEALTYPRPRGKWAQLHQELSHLGSVQIENVHILANLEPFRYGSPDFIQQSVTGMHEVMGGNGLHLYPQASYWDWPFSADSVNGKRLLQIERDWIWYKAWSRYAWKAKRDRNEEIKYWSALLAGKFGCSESDGREILTAYEESGEISPKILRRFGITDGNRQTMTLGMLMTQLINPNRYGLFTLLYESESPLGEMLGDYAKKEYLKLPHEGETPVQVAQEIRIHGEKALSAIESAAGGVTRQKEEFARLLNDMKCYKALADHYALKTEAALDALMFRYSHDTRWLDSCLRSLEQSVASYRDLVSLTRGSYLYANSMQTQQRKIPIRGVNGTFKTWAEVLVPFEKELDHFKKTLDSLKFHSGVAVPELLVLKNVDVAPRAIRYEQYACDSSAHAFTDTTLFISAAAPCLKDLTGWKMSFRRQVEEGTQLSFQNQRPVKLLIGYFNSKEKVFLQPPQLETDATANDRGGAEAKIVNAIVLNGTPSVNIHSFDFAPGANSIKLPRGACLILGFVDGSTNIPVYDAGISARGITQEIDWLFE